MERHEGRVGARGAGFSPAIDAGRPAVRLSPPHTCTLEEVCSDLGTSPSGLAPEEAQIRLGEFGPNELEARGGASAWAILLAQFKNVLILILLAATAVSAFLGHAVEAVAIAVIVLFAAVLGFVQEYRAERAMEALRKLAAPMARVVRGGRELSVPARELVPGDLILLRLGDRVAADARVLEAVGLQTHEAALTGESHPVEKGTATVLDASAGPGDRYNMVFAGTAVNYGRGRAIVTATGSRTEFGRIAELLQTVESGRTPLQVTLDHLGMALARAALVIVLIISILGILRGQGVLEMLIFGIALAVAVVPEALPAVVTISLALGVQRLVRRQALMRRLPAVEALGSTSVICSDKTGTLTRDEMAVHRVWLEGRLMDPAEADREAPSALRRLMKAAALASDARWLTDGGELRGTPTERAIVDAAAAVGLVKDDLDQACPRIDERPFASEKRMMVTLHRGPDGVFACAKGAPEVILEQCSRGVWDGVEHALTGAKRDEILAGARDMASGALRVLAVASGPATSLVDATGALVFRGLIGLLDPPRPEAKPAIETCRRAGIRVVMITGDHPNTAEAIARDLGLLRTGRVVTGAQLDAMSDRELERDVEQIEVYARVSPAHKLRVVTGLQKGGHVVAMTGDGVNDAPALKKADIGVAMGLTGTDVAIEAAAMTLTDDNFASIVAAVEEGRGIFGNIRKYLLFLLSSNIGEIGLMAGAALLGLPMPLSAVQILYVNLATDGLPALALAVDPPEPGLMERRPRDPRARLFSKPVTALMLVSGLWSALVNLALFAFLTGAGRPLSQAMGMTFVSLVLIQFMNAYNFRSDRSSILRRPFANRWLNLAILWELLLLLAILYVSWLHAPLGTFALTAADWALVGAVAMSIVPVIEAAKCVVRRGWLGPLD